MSNTGTTKADAIGAAVQKVDGLEVGRIYTDEEFVKAIDPAALEANRDHGDETDEPVPCTCTLACIPAGITAEQTCRMAM